MKALLVVDVQNDFCPGGALPAPYGNRIIPVINKLMNKFDYVYASKDWHPPDSIHFEKWPVHCVRETWGAELHPELRRDKINLILLKGTDNKDNGYSAFEATNVNFTKRLKENDIDELYITGLTTEYCVYNSAMDAVRAGFKTYVVEDAIAGVSENPNELENTQNEMKHSGIRFLNSEDV